MFSGFHLVKRKQFVQFSPNTPHPSLSEVLPSLSRAHRPAFPPPFSVLSQQIWNVCQLTVKPSLWTWPSPWQLLHGGPFGHIMYFTKCAYKSSNPHISPVVGFEDHTFLLVEVADEGQGQPLVSLQQRTIVCVLGRGCVCVYKSETLLVITLIKLYASCS